MKLRNPDKYFNLRITPTYYNWMLLLFETACLDLEGYFEWAVLSVTVV